MFYYIKDSVTEFVTESFAFRVALILAAVGTVPAYFLGSALNFAL